MVDHFLTFLSSVKLLKIIYKNVSLTFMQIKRKVAMAPLLLTLAIALIGGTVGQEIHVGDCPKIPTVENFNISRVSNVLSSYCLE